ncbi:protein CTLA-2-beta-like [Chionomys nivalis]|uniref:protein CTLA-2-beta-like n=1 Tax=Chionomys nivalis TaxID=269649 RepID=UPI0025960D80|nr:protein CTLA-2-beta-like [Chionomys nivalis]
MASASSLADPSLDAEWQEWKRKYEKSYSQDEEGHRRMVWEENKKKIEEHNTEYEQGKSSFCMGLNELSDLTSDEFWEMMTCSSDSVLEDQEIIDTCLLSDIPAFEDMTEDSNVSPERDQVKDIILFDGAADCGN